MDKVLEFLLFQEKYDIVVEDGSMSSVAIVRKNVVSENDGNLGRVASRLELDTAELTESEWVISGDEIAEYLRNGAAVSNVPLAEWVISKYTGRGTVIAEDGKIRVFKHIPFLGSENAYDSELVAVYGPKMVAEGLVYLVDASKPNSGGLVARVSHAKLSERKDIHGRRDSWYVVTPVEMAEKKPEGAVQIMYTSTHLLTMQEYEKHLNRDGGIGRPTQRSVGEDFPGTVRSSQRSARLR